MNVGGHLRRARTLHDLSIAEIAARTKISSTLLRAIEDNRFDGVPAGLFTRGYLRAYAREVHVNPEAIVEQYREEFEAPRLQTRRSTEESHWAADTEAAAAAEDGRGGSHFTGLIMVLLIGLAYFRFAGNMIPQPAPDNGAKPTDAVDVSPSTPVPTPTRGTLDAPRKASLKLAIQTTGDCWVAASIDGERVIARLMTAGEQVQFNVHDGVTIRVGDPATFTYTVDGIPGREVGTAGTPVSLKFNRQNYQTLLRQ
jgi:cytoskeletal protein RodZ